MKKFRLSLSTLPLSVEKPAQVRYADRTGLNQSRPMSRREPTQTMLVRLLAPPKLSWSVRILSQRLGDNYKRINVLQSTKA